MSNDLFLNIGGNIISIFTIVFVIILFLMYMFYIRCNGKMNELESKVSIMKKEKDFLINEIDTIRENEYNKVNENSNKFTKQDVNEIIKDVINEMKRENKEVSIVKQSVQPTALLNQMNYSNQIKEMYPVPIIPGGEFLRRGVISMRNVDFPYQDLTTTYQRIGTVASVDKNDDYMMTLYRRDIAPERDLYEYKVIDHTNGNNIEIFLNTNIALLRNGDKIIISGYESKGEFVVNLDRQYSYIRLRPFP